MPNSYRWDEVALQWSNVGKPTAGVRMFYIAGLALIFVVAILMPILMAIDQAHAEVKRADVVVTSIQTGGYSRPGSMPAPFISFYLPDHHLEVFASALPIHVGDHVEITYRAGRSGHIYVDRLDLPGYH